MAQAIGAIDALAGGPRPIGRAGNNFHATMARAGFGQLDIGIGRVYQAISISAVVANQHTFMFATEPAIVRRVSGRELFDQHIFYRRPNERTITSSPPGLPWAFAIITMPIDLLATHARALVGGAMDCRSMMTGCSWHRRRRWRALSGSRMT